MTANGRQNIKDRISTIMLSVLLLAVITSCGGGSETGSIGAGAPAPSLVSIEVTPADPVIALGTEMQFKATGIYSDNTKKDLTETVTWHASDDSIVTVSRGLAKSLARGTATIWAQSDSISASRVLTVTDALLVSIQLTPAHPEAALGTTKQFTATGIFSDGSMQDITQQVSWSSANDSIASVSNLEGTKGLTTSFAVGKTTISAALDSVSADMDFTVTAAVLISIEVTPANTSTPKGMTLQFTATGIYSNSSTQDITNQVTWNVSDPALASISNAAGTIGLATALAVGPTEISATLDGVTGSVDFTVTEAILVLIQITPVNPSLAKGTTLQLTATGNYSDSSTQDITNQVTWNVSVSDSALASVSNAAGTNGLATALAVGSATISATLGTATGTTTLEVTPATLLGIDISPPNLSLAKGTTLQLTATGNYSDSSTQDITNQVTWNVSDPAVASVSNAAGTNGLATALAVGSATISATLGSVDATTTLSVTAAVLVSIEVDPYDAATVVGVTRQFVASGVYSDSTVQDLTQQVTWSSTTRTVATISNAANSKGLATPRRVGSTVISATLDSVNGSTTLTVSNATLVSIMLTPASPSLPVGMTLQFTATGHYSNGMDLNITKAASWRSSRNNVARISNANASKGLATGVREGNAIITATLSNVSGRTTLTVE
ncbi:MAG TPA: Ig-like domain-containing protein [Syntrophales bacterium]|nr:Ig-like domain-containing protein [Syntrophales bacterium]HPN24341.1 Ig-like domain-containing protein [Syntrophales bacterium]HQM28971.1 Ig-like domain-containing protein [Syntrophales bacterium]